MKKQYFYLLLAISFIFSCNVSIDENAAKSVAKSVTEGVKEGMGENEESYEEVEGLEGLSPVEQLGQGKDIEDINYGPKMGYDKSKARINISKEEDESTGVGSSQGAMMGKVELKKDQPYEILQNSCNQFLNQQGKSLYGINSDGSIYSVQAAQTGRPSNQNSSNFIESRYIAYRKAELLAKIDILSLLAGASLTSSAAFSEIAQELGEYAQFDEEDLSLDEEFSVESFAEHIAANFAGLLMGCNVVKMAEGDLGDNDYQVAVCIKWSPENYKRVQNMNDVAVDPENLQGTDLFREIGNTPDEDLVTELGARMYFYDDLPIIIGYGQASIRSNNTSSQRRAFTRAKLRADNAIKTFLSESILGNRDDIVSEVSASYNASIRTNQESFENNNYATSTSSVFSQMIQAAESTIEMRTLKLKDWTGRHPVSGDMIGGSVVVLVNSDAFQNLVNRAMSDGEESGFEKTQRSDVFQSKTKKNQDF